MSRLIRALNVGDLGHIEIPAVVIPDAGQLGLGGIAETVRIGDATFQGHHRLRIIQLGARLFQSSVVNLQGRIKRWVYLDRLEELWVKGDLLIKRFISLFERLGAHVPSLLVATSA